MLCRCRIRRVAGILQGMDAGEARSTSRPGIPPQRKAAFGAIAVGLCILLLEFLGRIVTSVAPNARWEFEHNHVRTIGFPALNDILEPDPRRFWRLKANVDNQRIIGRVGEDDLVFHLSTDAAGHRRMPPVTVAKRTVLFLGDSCMLGIGVDDDAAIPAQTQRRLSQTQCLNAGVPGYSAYQGRVHLEQLLANTHVDDVVIQFGFNDDAVWDGRGDAAHAADLARGPAWPEQLGVVRLMRAVLPAPAGPTTQAAGGRPRLTDDEFGGQIEAILDLCAARRVRPVLVVWPLRVQTRGGPRTGKQVLIARLAAEQRVPLVDLLEEIVRRRSEPNARFADLLHFNESGCSLAAEVIARELSRLENPSGRVIDSPAP